MSRNPRGKNNNRIFAPEPSERILHEFSLPTDLPGLNALVIGSSVFETEQVLRLNRVRKVVIPLYYVHHLQYNLRTLRQLAQLIHELIIFTLSEDIDVEFRPVENKQTSLNITRQERYVPNICLFSGGTDSYSGVLVTEQALNQLEAVFCAHMDQGKTIHIVDYLWRNILRRKNINMVKIPLPSIRKGGYAQLRGFLYLLAATSVANKLRSERIVVTECGPTMYQPRFSPLDSITMTTHPFVMRTAAEVAGLLLQREIRVLTPFEDLTKAEVIAISPEKKGLKHTHSCISQRFGTHDGTCYGCVIRRLATTAAGVDDVSYAKNPIADSRANSGNLYALLNFCYEILTDFNAMEEYETGTINTYGKRDLFHRFALDNFAAIQRLLSENKRVVRPIRDMYGSLAQKVGTQKLTDRLRELTHPQILPNFKKIAK